LTVIEDLKIRLQETGQHTSVFSQNFRVNMHERNARAECRAILRDTDAAREHRNTKPQSECERRLPTILPATYHIFAVSRF
jgi:hypothetical protein